MFVLNTSGIVKVPIRHTIDVMCAMMETVQSEGTQPKEIVYQSLAPLVRPTIELVRVYAHDHSEFRGVFRLTVLG